MSSVNKNFYSLLNVQVNKNFYSLLNVQEIVLLVTYC